MYLSAGVRIHYWDLNKQVLVSPRVTLNLKPVWKKFEKDIGADVIEAAVAANNG